MLFSASIAYANASFKKTELVTDNRGIEIADRLGWRLTSHTLNLEGFCPNYAKHVWMLGKLQAQEIQTEPFVHIDLDLPMFTPIPSRLSRSIVFTQSKDHPKSYQDPFVRRIVDMCGINPNALPYNTGLIGWNDLEFMREYCRSATSLGLRAARLFDHGGCISIVCEQMLLGDMARIRGIEIDTAIPLPMHVHKSDMADVRFAHFWGASKWNAKHMRSIEAKFAKEHPVEYARFVKGWGLMSSSSSKCDYYETGSPINPE